ncbi:MAG: hypothetical protein ACQESC_04665, partial [Nanobdellota archaeon]
DSLNAKDNIELIVKYHEFTRYLLYDLQMDDTRWDSFFNFLKRDVGVDAESRLSMYRYELEDALKPAIKEELSQSLRKTMYRFTKNFEDYSPTFKLSIYLNSGIYTYKKENILALNREAIRIYLNNFWSECYGMYDAEKYNFTFSNK